MPEEWMDGYKRGGGVVALPYKECPILFLQQDIEDQMTQEEQSDIVAPLTISDPTMLKYIHNFFGFKF